MDCRRGGKGRPGRSTQPHLSSHQQRGGQQSADGGAFQHRQRLAQVHCPQLSHGLPRAGGFAEACATYRSLNPGYECDLPIKFEPTSYGGFNEHVTLTDNALNVPGASQSIAVSGGGGAAAQLIAPTSGVLPGSPTTKTFYWTAGTGVAYYDLYVGTKTWGDYDLYRIEHTNALNSGALSFMPQGLTIYVQLRSFVGGAWVNENYTFTEAAPVAAVLNAPTSGTLPTAPATYTFNWSAGTGVTDYDLQVGTKGAGSYDLYYLQHLTVTTSGPLSIPSQGQNVYVRLRSQIAGTWVNKDYTFREDASLAAVLTFPANGASMAYSPDAQNFTWSAGYGVTEYDLYLSTKGVGKKDLYDSGHIKALSTSYAFSPSLAPGTKIYGRLWSLIYGTWTTYDYVFYTSQPAVLTSPATVSGVGVSKLPAAPTPVTFWWTAGTGVAYYDLYASAKAFGGYELYRIEHTNLLNSGPLTFPADGQTIYIQLRSFVGGQWVNYNYTFTEQPPSPGILTSPATTSGVGNDPLGTAPVTFTWTAGAGVAQYDLYIGTTGAGSSNLYNIQHIPAGTLSSSPLTFAAQGQTVYVRLASQIVGAWVNEDYTFVESPYTLSAITSPLPAGSTLSASQSFTWSAGTGVTQYELQVGTRAVGDNNLYDSGHTAALSTTSPVTIPSHGATVYVRLWSYIGPGGWKSVDYTYVEP